jgi:hypothetical protein
MVPENVIPMRGSKEDWSGDKEDEILKKKKDYAKTLIKNQLLGSPDFSKYETFLSLSKDLVDKTQNASNDSNE